MSLIKTTIFGLSWVAGLRALMRALAIIKIAILARLLVPAQFGVFGVATLILGFLEIITETGINIFLVQEKSKIDEYVNSAWVVSIIRGGLIAISIIILAPFLGDFFSVVGSISILYLISLVAFIRGFINPSIIKFQKDFSFNKYFYYESLLAIVDFTVAVSLTYFTRSEYSLIWAMVASSIIEVIVSFAVASPRPKFKIEFEKVKRVIDRGRWITGAGVFNYLFQNLDDILVSKLLGVNLLGVYQQAYKISTIPVSEVGEIFNKVTFPVYASISTDKQRLKKAFLKTLLTICLFVIPFGIFVYLFADFIVITFLGSKWIDAIAPLKILAIFGVVKAIYNSFFSLFLALGKQEIVTITTLISLVFLAVSIYPLISIFGLLGAGYATIFATLASFPFTIYFFKKEMK